MGHFDGGSGGLVANAAESQRADFIKRTYVHLAGAIAAFALIEAALQQTGLAAAFSQWVFSSRWLWLGVLGAFMLVSTVANNWAHSGASRQKQYLGLGVYIVAESIFFIPLIYMALQKAPDGHILQNAAITTAALVAGLTFTAFSTKINFSFMGRFLMIGGFVAMGMILAGILFGFHLGLWFTGAMIIFAAASVLYSTSNIIHEYHTEQHVAASLSLFASVGLLFWYILQFFMSMGDD